MKRLTIYFMALIVIINFTSCGKKQQSGSVVLNDILQLQQAQINSFDPLDAYHAGHIQMVKQLYNTLTDIDLTGKTTPSLAKSWDTPDGLNWTFYLRDDVAFFKDSCFANSEDRNFTGGDVKYTFERLLGPKSQSLGVSYFSNLAGLGDFRAGIADHISGIIAEDAHTILFKLNQPDYNFPNLLTLPYVSIVKEKAVSFYEENFKLHPVGTGPFELQSFKSNEEVVLTKNGDYWEESEGHSLPFVDELDIHLTTDDNLSLLMFKNRRTDFLELNLPMQKQLESTNVPFKYGKETIQLTQLYFYLFNLERLSDPDVRQGISYAIDREKLSEIIGDQGVVTTSLFPSIFSDLTKPNDRLAYSPDKAKNLLGKNKQKTLNLVCFEDILSRALADLLAKQLKEYGVIVEIEAVTFPVLVDRLTSGNYDMVQIYWGPLYADVRHFLNPFITASFPPAGNNFNKYSNAEFDSLVETAPSLPQDQQIAQYLKAQDIILSDMPFFLAYYKNMIRVSDEKFEMPLHPLVYRFYKFARPK